MSKIVKSRDEWKQKAVQRSDKIREYRKSEQRHRDKIVELKAQLMTIEQARVDNEKKQM